MLKRIVAATAVALALAMPAAYAQSKSSSQSSQSSSQQMVSEKDVKGATVNDAKGQKIGSIDHLVIDKASGKARFAVVGAGGGKNIAIPWERLQASGSDNKTFTVNVDKNIATSAPTVDTSNLSALDQPQMQQQISSYWERASSGSEQAQTPGSSSKSKSQGE
ncbi:MAG: PRC-barrel domain-containing protein [Actinomycetota bacterium]